MDFIPLVDLKAAHAEIEDEVRAGFDHVLANTAFILGEDVQKFEAEFAAFCGAKSCIGVSNGTDALELALRAVGVGPGDEVIVPANSFVATALGVVRAGAKPVFADCDPEFLLLDPAAMADKITPRTKAIMPVHLYGQVAPMEAITDAAGSCFIVEDAAQAQGAARNGRRAGSIGHVAGTSFYPGKNLGAYGDAGAVVTNDEQIDARLRELRNYGSVVKYHHPVVGFNCRLDTLQAVVLRAKLKRLDAGNEARRQAARRYDEMLKDVPGVRRVGTAPGNEHIYHLYVIRVVNRDDVLGKLNANGVGAGIHYPTPLPLLEAFADMGHREGEFPVSEAATKDVLSLPLFPQITPAQQERVIEVLTGALG